MENLTSLKKSVIIHATTPIRSCKHLSLLQYISRIRIILKDIGLGAGLLRLLEAFSYMLHILKTYCV